MKRKFYKTLHAVTVSALTVMMAYNSQLNASPFHPNEDIEESRKRPRGSDNEQTSANKRPKVSHTEDSERLGRLEYDGFYINVDANDLDDQISTCPLRKQIEETIKGNKISKEDPLRLVIGEGIADDQNSFNAFIDYLRNTKLKDMILSVDEWSENNITTFGFNFLADNRLTSFSAEGLENVKSIGRFFLYRNDLTSFSAKGFDNLTSIGSDFLAHNQLTSFSAEGLENVTSIGYSFLACNQLTSFSAEGFNNLIAIGNFFLSANRLTSISAEGLENVTSIGHSFLSANRLTSFSAEGLENVKSIGGFFLHRNRLTSFSAKGFDNLTTIEDYFLCENQLTSFSAEGFTNLQSIGDKFLIGNQKLKMIDLRAFSKVTSVGKGFLKNCENIEEIIVTEEKADFFKQHIPEEHQNKIRVIDEKQ